MMRAIPLTVALAFIASMSAPGCSPTRLEELGVDESLITAEQCEEVSWPDDCPDYEEMKAADCNRKWMVDKQGRDLWKPDRPVCFGFGKDIDECGNCNRLQINDYSKCKNKLFLWCAQNNHLPGQGKDNPPCPVTPPDDVKWPQPGSGSNSPPGATTLEYCDLGSVSDDEDAGKKVEECRRKAKCEEDPES